jgi:hypothetical protein
MCYFMLRLAFLFIIVTWLVIGAIPYSILWPHQVRKRISEIVDNTCSNVWTSVIRVFADKRSNSSKGAPFGSKSVYYLIPRVMCVFLIIIWLIIGTILCGLIWPPQVREMFWDYFVPQKSTTDEVLSINNIVKNQEAAKMSEENLKEMVTEIRAEIAYLTERHDFMLCMMKKITQLLEKQEEQNH